MKHKAANPNDAGSNNYSFPDSNYPYIPRFPGTDAIPVAGNPGLSLTGDDLGPGTEGSNPMNYDTPHHNRLGIPVTIAPSSPKPAVTPYTIPPMPKG